MFIIAVLIITIGKVTPEPPPDSSWAKDAVTSLNSDSRTAESALFQAIMGNYRSNVRPVRKINDTVIVSARLFPIKIQSLKERDEVLSMTLRLQLGWSDLSLVWNPADYGGLDRIVVNAYDLWLPDLQIANSAEDMYQLMRDRQFAVKIHNNGEIWWHPTGSVSVRCELDLIFFPFDLQRCSITLESVIHTINQLNLTVRKDRAPISFSMYTENGVWEMILATGTTSSYYVSTRTAFSRVSFMLYLHRRTSYYKLNIIFPCAMLSGLQLLTFLLPLNNQERVPQSTTILLSVVVFQTVVVEELPRTSNSLSLLSVYISLLTGISVASVADSVAIAYLISLSDRAFQVPKWAVFPLRLVSRPTRDMKIGQKTSPQSGDVVKNTRCNIASRQGNFAMDELIREGLRQEAPLSFIDYNYSAALENGSNDGYPMGGSRFHHHRTLTPPNNRIRRIIKSRSRSQQHIAQGHFEADPRFIDPAAIRYSISNGDSLDDEPMLTPTRSRFYSESHCQPKCQSSDTKMRNYSVEPGREIVFVRWYKSVFLLCLLLIVFVPVVLFLVLPPDVTQYRLFKSPMAASPPY